MMRIWCCILGTVLSYAKNTTVITVGTVGVPFKAVDTQCQATWEVSVSHLAVSKHLDVLHHGHKASECWA